MPENTPHTPGRPHGRGCRLGLRRPRGARRHGPARPARRSRLLRPAGAAALALLAGLAAPLTLPGVAAPAAATPCRTQVLGSELAENAGPYPLIDQLGLRQAWDLSTGEGVRVGVVDSGVDARHPDLGREAVVRGSEFTAVATAEQTRRSTPQPKQDCSGHGTAIAGLIAARRSAGDRMTGVAPDATVYPVRLDGTIEQLPPQTIAAAIEDAVDHHVDVLNLSFGRPVDDPDIRAAVEHALAADVLVVAAAGNEGGGGPTGGLMYPAAYEGVLAVGAVTDQGVPMDSSNTGPWIDLAAYGENLTVTAPGGSGYRTVAGNSFAAAQVSGVAALVRSRFPRLSAQEVAQRLIESASPVGGGRNEATGAGIVDPFGALTHLGTGEAATPGTGEEAPGRVPLQAVPRTEPLVDPATARALAWSGGLLLGCALCLLGAPAIRRAAARGWRARIASPAAPAPRVPARPAEPALRLLDGGGAPASTTPARGRKGS